MRLKNLLLSARDRVLNNNEYLLKEGQSQNYLYMLMSGKLRVERQVQVESLNYWPEDTQTTWT